MLVAVHNLSHLQHSVLTFASQDLTGRVGGRQAPPQQQIVSSQVIYFAIFASSCGQKKSISTFVTSRAVSVSESSD